MSDFDDFAAFQFQPTASTTDPDDTFNRSANATFTASQLPKKQSRRSKPKMSLAAAPLAHDEGLEDALPPFEGFSAEGQAPTSTLPPHQEESLSEEWSEEDEEFRQAAASKARAIPRVSSSGGGGGFYSSSYPSATSPPPDQESQLGSSVPQGGVTSLLNHPSLQTLVSSARLSLDYSKMAMDNAADLTRRGGAAFMEDVMPVLVAAASATAATSAEAIALGVPRVSQALSTAQAHLQASALPACVQQAKNVQRWLAARVHLTLPPPTIAPAQSEKEELGGYIEYIERALKAEEEAAEARSAARAAGVTVTSPSPTTPNTSTTYLSGQPVVLYDDHFSVLTQKEKAKLEDFLNDWKRVRSQAALMEGNDRVTQELKTRFEAKEMSEGAQSATTQPQLQQPSQLFAQPYSQPGFQHQQHQQQHYPAQQGSLDATGGFSATPQMLGGVLQPPSAYTQQTPVGYAPSPGVFSSSATTTSSGAAADLMYSQAQPGVSGFYSQSPMIHQSHMMPHQQSYPQLQPQQPSHTASSALHPSPFLTHQSTPPLHLQATPQPMPGSFAPASAHFTPQITPQFPPQHSSSPAFQPQSQPGSMLQPPASNYPSQSPPAMIPAAASHTSQRSFSTSQPPFQPSPLDTSAIGGGFGSAPFLNTFDGALPSLDSLAIQTQLGFGAGLASPFSFNEPLSSNPASPGQITTPSLQTVSRTSSTSSIPLNDSVSPPALAFPPSAVPASSSSTDFLAALKSKSDAMAAKTAEPVPAPSSEVPVAPPLEIPDAPPMAPPLSLDSIPSAPPLAPDVPALPATPVDLPPSLKHPKPTVPLKHVHWHKLKHHDVQGTVFEDILEGATNTVTQVASEGAELPLSPVAHSGATTSAVPTPASSHPSASPLPATSSTPLLPSAAGAFSSLPANLASIDIDLNVRDLEEKFYSGTRRKGPTKDVAASASKKKKDETESLALPSGIDQLRAQNAEISLSRLKMQPEQIRDYLFLRVTRPPTPSGSSSSSSSSDPSNPLVHSADALEILTKVCPTEEEAMIIQKTRRTPEQATKVHVVESTFRTLIEVPRVKRRVELLLFRLESAATVKYLSDSITLVEQAHAELKNSHSLRYILKLVLTIGNFLNHATTNLGCAWGFRLNFLKSINATKTSDGSMTLMHWMIEEIENQRAKFLEMHATLADADSSTDREEGEVIKDNIQNEGLLTAAAAPPEVLQLLTELEHVQAAAAVDSAALGASLQGMKAKLVAISNEIKLTTTKNAGIAEPEKLDGFGAFMQKFLAEFQLEYESLQARFDAAVTACDQLARYFAETEPLKFEALFENFASFLKSYSAAVTDVRNKAKKMQQQQTQIKKTAPPLQVQPKLVEAPLPSLQKTVEVNELKTEEMQPVPIDSSDSSMLLGTSSFSEFDASALSAAINTLINGETTGSSSRSIMIDVPPNTSAGVAVSCVGSSSLLMDESTLPGSATSTPHAAVTTPLSARSTALALTTSSSSGSLKPRKKLSKSKIAITPLNE